MLCTTPKNRNARLASCGLTLVEMLIGMAITLVMMAAVVTLFANIGAGVRVQRASMELGSQLRTARARLFKDLAGATCAARPKLPSDDHDDGYLELIEGEYSDKNPTGIALPFASDTIIPSSQNNPLDGAGLGDYDDILALTVRSESEPFVGRMPVWDATINDGQGNAGWWRMTTIESDLAEVIWYSVENPADGSLGEPGMRTVYRRVLLIAPWVVDLPLYIGAAPAKRNAVDDSEYFRLCDVSFRREGSMRIPNTLSDLTKRENRFAHRVLLPSSFPHAMQLQNIRVAPFTDLSPFHPFGENFENLKAEEAESSEREGEDVMLNDVLAFDLRVFDPGAPLLTNATGLVLEPSDAGWVVPTVANTVGYGAYVDLFWNRTGSPVPSGANIPQTFFEGVAHVKSKLTITAPPAPFASITYDTWPYHYESDGINQDGDNDAGGNPLIDEGTNGLDDAPQGNGVDDSLERETAPPYDTPLRGMQVKIRIYDRESRQIREATVTRNFVPQ